jgi:hypothetical protein
LYNAISNIELNLKLGPRRLLIKDYKTYRMIKGGEIGVGLSSMYVPLHIFLKEFGIETITKEMDKLMLDSQLGLFGILCLSKEYEDG